MDLSLDLEAILVKKRLSVRHLLLIFAFIFFFFFAFLTGVAEKNYCAIFAVFLAGLLSISFFREIKILTERNHVISFQRNIATNSFDASLFAFFVFSKNGNCIFFNQVAQNLFPGFNIKNIDDFIKCFSNYPHVVEAIHKLQIAAENMRQYHIDLPMKLNSEHIALWRIAVAPLPLQSGFTGWTIVDLTPSESQIASLETNSKFLLEIINSSNVGYFSIDKGNKIVFGNDAFLRWISSRPETVINEDIFKYIIKENSESLPSSNGNGKLTNILPSSITFKSEVNDEINVIVREIMQNSEGLKTYIASRDNILQNDLLKALGKTKIYFEHIFEDAPFGILVTEGTEIIVSCNKKFREIVGVKKIETNVESVLDYIPKESQETVREKLYQLIDGVYTSIPPFEIEFKTEKNSGSSEKTIKIFVTKIDDTKRGALEVSRALVLYFIDISDRKSLQYQFVQSQKMQAVGQLAGGIAHDFNNLLTAMIGYCDLLLEKYSPSDQSFNDIMQIKQNANRASNLVRQLLAFSRQQTLQPKILNVTDMLSELNALLRRLIGAKIELKVIHDREVGNIKVDQIQFEQVIINLAVNARDAMTEGGLLTIKTSTYSSTEPKFLREDTMPPGNYVLIQVQDTGSGISEEYLNRIFDPFFSTKAKGHGTGLGLSTVYGIVNQTGGFITVDSKIESGTTFSLYFPMVTNNDENPQDLTTKNSPQKIVDLTGSGTILLVEDEDAVRMFSARALRDKGYRVIEASNGEAAFEYLKNEAPHIDLIITDVVMPKMDGPALIEHLKERNSEIKVIFISGYTEDSFRESIANNSSVRFLQKPFNLKELAHKVKEVLG